MPVWIGPFRLSEKSKTGFILSILSNIIFFGVGIGLLVYAYMQYQDGVQGPQLYIMAGVGAVFLLMSVFSFRSSLRARERAEELAALKEKHADEPWMVRPAWRTSEVPEQTGDGRSLTVMAIFWNLFTWPLAGYLIYNEFTQAGDPQWGVLMVLIFPLIGIGLGVAAGIKFFRRRKYGISICTMETMPGRLGQYLKARVKTGMKAADAPQDGFHVQLSCYRRYIRYTTDSDGDRKKEVEKDLKWRDEKHVRGKPYGTQNKLELPISFKLPEDARTSTPEKSEERIMWQLDVSADVPGLDYKSSFEIPVFEADEDAPPPEAPAAEAEEESSGAEEGNVFWELGDEGAQKLTHDEKSEASATEADVDPYADYEVGDEFTEPVTKGITMNRTPGGGLQFDFSADRNRTSAIVIGLLGVAFLIGTFFLISESFFGGLILLAFGAIMVYGAIYSWTKSSTVTVENGQVQIESRSFGKSSTEAFSCDQLISVRAEIRPNSSGGSYRLNIYRADPSGRQKIEQGAEKLDQFADFIEQTGVMGEKSDDADDPFKHIKKAIEKHGQIVNVTDNLSNKQEADWIAGKIQKAAQRESQFS